jgi:hypothetical protein
LLEPLTVAVNCWVPVEEMVALVGETESVTVGGSTVTLAEAEALVLAWLVAFTVTLMVEVQAGAVSMPELEMEPAEALQVTAVLLEPLTVAVNCWVPPAEIVAVRGEIETATSLGGVTDTVAEPELELLA